MGRRVDVVTALVPLPRYYNPDEQGNRRRVEESKFTQTADEIARAFQEGGTLHLPPEGSLKGFWWKKGIVDTDVLALLEVDLPNTQENREWLIRYAKEVLLDRFCQDAMYIKFVEPVDRLLVSRVDISK